MLHEGSYENAPNIQTLQDVRLDKPSRFALASHASFCIKGTDLSAAYRVARKNGGYVIFFRSGHSNFAVTHPGMYRFLPTDVNSQKKSCSLVVVFRDILWWLVMCAQEARCFIPNSSRKCTFVAHDYYKKYAKCHRFDQAAINLILSNIWIQDNSMVYNANETFFAVDRHVTLEYSIRTCKHTL
ncbi:hypothetical protein LSAT2_010059 [Lamellibrachia satsuma]|nr:hypothetical protein LSAT2_010059 [Lamellibrachia satsuma]